MRYKYTIFLGLGKVGQALQKSALKLFFFRYKNRQKLAIIASLLPKHIFNF
jgi:hypothetical protein